MAHLVNRTDVWGRYTRRKSDEFSRAVTAPFRDERGKVFLDTDSLRKHFGRGRQAASLEFIARRPISPRAGSPSTSICMGMTIASYSLSVSQEGNLAAACEWRKLLAERGLDPLLMDSNGIGGFHLLVVFAEPMSTDSAHQFGSRLVAGFEKRGLERRPEIFPDTPTWDRYGDWLRLSGRHHSRTHYTRVWNDEPFAEAPWLEGFDATN